MREGVSTVGVHSTTATSDDDVTHYHAYTQTSDSDQRSSKFKLTGLTRSRRNNGRGPAHRKAGRSFDPSAKDVLEGGAGFRPPYQSSSDLSSPNNETCYSFVRRALQVNYSILIHTKGPSINGVTLLGGGGSTKRWCYSISLFSNTSDMAGGRGQNLKKWVTSFMDVPKMGIKFGFSLERICEKERRKKKRDRVSKKFYNI